MERDSVSRIARLIQENNHEVNWRWGWHHRSRRRNCINDPAGPDQAGGLENAVMGGSGQLGRPQIVLSAASPRPRATAQSRIAATGHNIESNTAVPIGRPLLTARQIINKGSTEKQNQEREAGEHPGGHGQRTTSHLPPHPVSSSFAHAFHCFQLASNSALAASKVAARLSVRRTSGAGPRTNADDWASTNFVDAAYIPVAAEHQVVSAILVDLGAEPGWAHLGASSKALGIAWARPVDGGLIPGQLRFAR
jgi:hypothetical protein